jgi:N-methylhydantoinase B/oxoprolinase/acetone carboxylase alpha subunit
MRKIWIGIDTGGTFTDLVLVDLTTGTYHPLPRDSVLSIRTPGGGGFGTVEQRDPLQIEQDIREERISGEHAQEVYRWHTPA